MESEQEFVKKLIEEEYWNIFLENNNDVQLLIEEREFEDEVMYITRFNRFPIPVYGITMKNGDWDWKVYYE